MPAACEFAVVTGGGSGIGRALVIALSAEPVKVLAVGRRAAAVEQTAKLAPGKVIALSADVATQAGREAVAAAVGDSARVRYLVHAAGVQPIARLVDVTPESWRAVMATNLDARLFLTQRLVPSLAGGGRVLFVGSRSATRARRGAIAYCTSQAGSFMLHECLKLELAEQHILVALAIPGGVNTAMVQRSMGADPAVFPDQAEYVAAARQGGLIEPAIVARFFRWLLVETEDEQYAARPWDIRDPGHQPHWLGTDALSPGG